ncbi:protocatechuate 3,4-dioxygenase beta subunit [Tenacibaculum sp. MAR_2009_124]|uniref:dioxygenase family protein n=1 Tax=Tenacibaculum sp. MAR_2009_124 TaxID=1250059 RepID=UPI00089AA8DE|nr:intradiol ring-cleavage dioxygenase [Tenacibaculum sp. MAR_2009_124]SEB52004.1 protocatechuate 3,4-dioxygenase beta subunit [Tenacibaculum sp. MAR_2009_124]
MNIKMIRTRLFCLAISILTISCRAQQSKTIGGACQGCEAIHEYENKKLSPVDTLPGFYNNTPRLKISGTVFKKDGETFAENVILYIYHTNRHGIYEKKEKESGWGKIHGYNRGWIKTGKNGNYTFYTFKPAAYPNRSEPEHIHLIVKEPHINEYYLDSYFFLDDPLLTPNKKEKLTNRGGSGITKPTINNGILSIKRDIILGRNIPNYK